VIHCIANLQHKRYIELYFKQVMCVLLFFAVQIWNLPFHLAQV